MKVSAVGFLFQNNLKNVDKSLSGKNYTCVVHKKNGTGLYTRTETSSPIIQEKVIDLVTPAAAQDEVTGFLDIISNEDSDAKFIGAAIKDGEEETEIHSLFPDRLFAVRTKGEDGKNRFQVLTKADTKDVLARNLYLTA